MQEVFHSQRTAAVPFEIRLQIVDRLAVGEPRQRERAEELGLVRDLDREHARSLRRVPLIRAAVVGQRGAHCGLVAAAGHGHQGHGRGQQRDGHARARRHEASLSPWPSIAKPKPDYCLIDPACRPFVDGEREQCDVAGERMLEPVGEWRRRRLLG